MGARGRQARFSDRQFEASHGKRPRGRGYWAFEMVYRVSGTPGDVWWSEPNELYSAAKVRAMARAKELGYDEVNLLP